MNADVVLATIHILEEHGRLPISQVAALLGVGVAEVRGQLEAFNDVETSRLVLEPMFTIVPEAGWPETGPDPEPADSDLVGFSPNMRGSDLGLVHQDAAVLGPLLAAADELRAMEPDNLDLASAVDKLRTRLVRNVTGSASFRARTAAIFKQAADEHRAVRITYSGAWYPKVTARVIHPYRVVSTSRGYEVDAGPLDDRGRPRTFLLRRVRDFEVLADRFEIPPAAEGAIDANRQLTAVEGLAPHRAMWAIRNWSERVDQYQSDTADVRFTAWVLPPVRARVALMSLVAGSGVEWDDPDLAAAPAELAAELLAHHALAPAPQE